MPSSSVIPTPTNGEFSSLSAAIATSLNADANAAFSTWNAPSRSVLSARSNATGASPSTLVVSVILASPQTISQLLSETMNIVVSPPAFDMACTAEINSLPTLMVNASS